MNTYMVTDSYTIGNHELKDEISFVGTQGSVSSQAVDWKEEAGVLQ